METLKLEHIKPYFFGLKVMCGLHRKSATMFTLIGLSSIMYGKRIKEMCSLRNDTDSEKCGISEIKPILHPLSDLTKPIQHNGEEFRVQDLSIHAFATTKQLINPKWMIANCFYDDLKILFKWRFAVDIPSHLWIDVNTLEENPYK